MRPRYTDSVAFLKRWKPEGPWVLSAIQHGKKRTLTTATFELDEIDKLKAWLTKHGKSENIYFSVNPTRYPVFKKAERADIAKLAWLHVDVDPRAGEDLAEEQARILRLFKEDLPEGIPEPTCVVFSGGGYQGFWALTDPMELDGDVALCEKAKLYNLQIEQAFDADACHNVDRIMRLPGTVNRPDEKKRKKGRVEALAQVEFWNDTEYVLGDFAPAAPVQTADTGFASARPVSVSGNVRRLDSLDELGPDVKDYTKAVINIGHDAEDPGKWSSRSDVVWYISCELVRCNVDDDTIFSILTDPDFGISAHILDQDNPERSALRQIERAHEHAIHPELRRVNEKHAVVGDIGGKCRIISEVADGHIAGRTRLSFQAFADFRGRYMNKFVEVPSATGGPPTTRRLGDWWLGHPQRRQYETIIFAPEIEVPGAYNLWKGFAYQSKPGKCDLFLAHVLDNVCAGNAEHFEYLFGWMATAVQKPASPGHTAIVMRGDQGTGKSFFAKTFGKLFGRHFLQVSDPKHLVGSFNAHLRDCVVLFGDEAFYAGDKKHESVLKMLVTEETITIEAKGVDVVAAPNFVHLLMASNSDWVVPAGTGERRYLVLDVSDDQRRKSSYFRAIQAELDDGGYEALLYKLRTLDLSKFDVRALPRTAGLTEQKILSYKPTEDWWFSKLQSGEILTDRDWSDEVISSEVNEDYATSMKMFGGWTERSSATRLGLFLKKVVPPGWTLRGRRSGSVEVTVRGYTKRVNNPKTYRLPSLAVCRKLWDENFGGPFDWPKIDEVPGELVDQEPPF